MEGRHEPVTDYRHSAAAVSPLPNSFYNYLHRLNHRPPLSDDSDQRLLTLWDYVIVVAGLLMAVAFTSLLIFATFYYVEERPHFRLDSFSLSNFTVTNDSRVSMIAQVQLTARNPNNKYSLEYDRIVTSICYKHQQLSQAFVPPFSQKKKQKTSLEANFAGDGVAVDKWAVDGIDAEIGTNGRVGFDFWFISSIAWANDTPDADTLKVLCRNLVVDIPVNGSAAGRLTGKPKTCQVDSHNY